MTKQYLALQSTKNEKENLLSIVEREISDLPEGDILIKVEYSSLNYKDAMSAKGYPGVTKEYPHTPGIDAAGFIVESASQDFKEGDSVIVTGYDLGMNTSGGFAEYIRVPSSWIIPLPEGLSMKDSMILGTAGLTAGLSINALERHRGIQGLNSLITGSTGGVGSIATLLLSKLGANVTAVTGKEDKANFLKSLGANEILTRDDLFETVRKPLNKPLWDIAVDVAGGDMVPYILAALKPSGAVACSGLVAGTSFESSIFPFILRGVSLLGIDSVEISLKAKEFIWKKFSSEWSLGSLESISKEVSLSELSDEIDLILSGNQTGRILVKI
mgnify:CR=1 FL=1